jgi:hypothetical protein
MSIGDGLGGRVCETCLKFTSLTAYLVPLPSGCLEEFSIMVNFLSSSLRSLTYTW